MDNATPLPQLTLDADSGLLRLLVIALDKVQRRRHRPKKQGPLHRV